MQQTPLLPMYRDGVVGVITACERLIVSNHQPMFSPQTLQHLLGESRVSVIKQSRMPWTRNAVECRRKAMHRNEDRAPLLCTPSVQFGANSIVIRVEELPCTTGGFLHSDHFIAGYASCLAHSDNRLGNARTAVAVNHQSRITKENGKRIECVRKLDSNTRRADIPRNMPLQI